MAWTVITRDSLDIDEYNELPFGRFNEALPFLVAFLASSDSESDCVTLDVSNRGKLQRAIVKHSGITLEMRTEKRDGTKLDKPVAIVDSAAVNRAMDSLGISLVRYAKEGENELLAIRRVS